LRLVNFYPRMSKKHQNSEDTMVAVEDALTKSEIFIERNRNILIGVLSGVVLIVAGVLLYRTYVQKPAELAAQADMFKAEFFFEKDSFELALNGKGDAPGFLTIIDDHSGTKAGNLANYYAGVCYLQLGKFQEAVDYLDKFDGGDLLVSSVAIGAKGDALMELGKRDEAIEHYVKAAGKNENYFTTPIYLLKAGLAYEDAGNFAKALEAYKKIKKDFFQSTEARDIDKYIGRAEINVQAN